MPEERIPAFIRREVWERANGCCEYCQTPEAYSVCAFAVDHVLPASLGGSTIQVNLALACPGCNGHKGKKTQGLDSLTGNWVRLFDPRRESWYEHFAWSADGLTILGLTTVGRATVIALKMNRTGIMNIRQVLLKVGRHPGIQ
jgi:hypothetical protein